MPGRNTIVATVAAALCAAPLWGSAIAKPVTLSLVFKVKSSGGLHGSVPATLTFNKGAVSGQLTYDGYTCVVNPGSTDVKKALNMTCSVEGLDTVTVTGTLSIETGIGKGNVSDTFYNETGTYTVKKKK